jgi:hypothetical protein
MAAANGDRAPARELPAGIQRDNIVVAIRSNASIRVSGIAVKTPHVFARHFSSATRQLTIACATGAQSVIQTILFQRNGAANRIEFLCAFSAR